MSDTIPSPPPSEVTTGTQHEQPEPISEAEKFAILVGQIIAPLKDATQNLADAVLALRQDLKERGEADVRRDNRITRLEFDVLEIREKITELKPA